MKQVFAPGCAFMGYKPELAEKIFEHLKKESENIEMYLSCCQKEPKLPKGTQIINICSWCNNKYKELYEGISTISLWKFLADSESFPFPNYSGEEMTIHDPCPMRKNPEIHESVRKVLEKMNIKIIETKNNRQNSTCCGDFPDCSEDIVKAAMIKRANEMPRKSVVVYCLSCSNSMNIGGKNPRHLADLLFNENSNPSKPIKYRIL